MQPAPVTVTVVPASADVDVTVAAEAAAASAALEQSAAGPSQQPVQPPPQPQPAQAPDSVTILRRSLVLPFGPGEGGGPAVGLSATRPLAEEESRLALTDLSEGPDEAPTEPPHHSPASSLLVAVAGQEGRAAAMQPLSIEAPPAKRDPSAHIGSAAAAWTEAEPLLRAHPNARNPNVDVSRSRPVPCPPPAAASASEPHVVASTRPWLQRWVDRRWRLLFAAYRRLDVWGLRGFALCELAFIAVYGLANLALVVAGIAQLATASHDRSASVGAGQSHGGGNNGDGKSELYAIGQSFGSYGTINVLLLLLPIARSNVWQYILGMSFERSVFYHKWIARVAIAELAIHGAAIYADSYYASTLWADASDGGVTGLYGSGSIAFFVGVAIVLLSLWPFRRYLHESFLRVHLVLFVAFLVLGFIHDGTVALVVPALILYGVDWWLRISMWRQPVRVLSLKRLPGGVTRITFQKDQFTYQAGQYIFVCIPAVSPFEWHPFSLSSSPHHPLLTVHCKTIGRWTRRLAELAQAGEAERRDWTKLRMHTEGPYGQLSVPLARYSSVLLVCGGIGVTPLGSVYNELVHEHYRGTRRLRQLKLVWSVRDPLLISSLYDDPRQAAAVASEERADAFFFRPNSLAQRDALVSAATGRPIPPLTGRINNAFHVTQAGRLSADADTVSEQLRGVRSYYGEWLKEGRPELALAFKEVSAAIGAQQAEQERLVAVTVVPAGGGQPQPLELAANRCAVLACGPRLLIDDVRALCIRQSGDAVRFDLHEEEFAW